MFKTVRFDWNLSKTGLFSITAYFENNRIFFTSGWKISELCEFANENPCWKKSHLLVTSIFRNFLPQRAQLAEETRRRRTEARYDGKVWLRFAHFPLTKLEIPNVNTNRFLAALWQFVAQKFKNKPKIRNACSRGDGAIFSAVGL